MQALKERKEFQLPFPLEKGVSLPPSLEVAAWEKPEERDRP